MTGDLAGFLRARLDDDEAEAATFDGLPGMRRQRREVVAKRAIMARHRDDGEGMCAGCPTGEMHWDPQYEISECPELRDLAAVYSDHADYRQEWTP